jgi:microcystin-dependent protein
MGQTPNLSLPYPELGDTGDVPRDIKALAEAVDGSSQTPAGVIEMWPGTAAPPGFFLCNGQSVPAAANPGLAAIFGTVGGNVPLPDLRGRVLVGTAPINVPAAGDPARALRASGGLALVKLTGPQSGIAQHSHPAPSGGRFLTTLGGTNTNASGTGGYTLNTSTGTSGPVDAAQAHENMPPYYAINYIIREG